MLHPPLSFQARILVDYPDCASSILSDWPTLLNTTLLLLLVLLLLCVTVPSCFQARMLIENPDCASYILSHWPTLLKAKREEFGSNEAVLKEVFEAVRSVFFLVADSAPK
jgi:hypothetical protein